jgi:Fic family protein
VYEPRFQITPLLLRLVTEASEIRVWIAAAAVDVAWLPALQRDTASRLAHSSTAIEGNPLTLPDVEALARGDTLGASPKAEREVLNHLTAMRWVWARKPEAPFGEGDLLKLHRLLVAGTLPAGVPDEGYKTRPNRVVDRRGVTIYTPPRPAQAGPLSRDLLAWIGGRESQDLHPILVSGVTHHRLVSIHPFADGNGRAARALALWVLMTRGFDSLHVLALDEFYESDRPRYYNTIQQARDLDDDLTHWLEYVADGIVQTLRRTKERILSLRVAAKGNKVILTKRQEDVLRFLRDRGRIKSPEIERALGLTRARVGQIMRPLLDAGLVLREGRTRATTYRLSTG